MEATLTPLMSGTPDGVGLGRDMTALDPEMIEVALLLPRWQAVALQTVAKQRGMSAGQMIRRMIGATVGSQPPRAVG